MKTEINNHKASIEKKSTFNPAVRYVESLAKLMDITDYAFVYDKPDLMFRCLLRLYDRIQHKLSLEEDKEIKEFIDKKIMGFLKIKKWNVIYPNIIFKFRELDVKLKKLMDKYGLLMPSQNDPRFAVFE